MTKTKKVFSVFLALILLLSCVPTSYSMAAETSELPIEQEEIAEEINLQLDGITDINGRLKATGISCSDEYGNMIYYYEDEPSEFGLTHGYWFYADGSPVEVKRDEPVVSANSGDVTAEPLPISYDARDDGLITSVKSQTGGTCWAHSAMASLEANSIKNGYKSIDTNLSEYHAVWYGRSGTFANNTDSRNDSYTDPDGVISGGNYNDITRIQYVFAGAAEESNLPTLNCSNASTLLSSMQNNLSFDKKYTTDTILSNIIQVSTDDYDELKQAILDYGALMLSYYSHVNEGDPYMSRTSGKTAVYCPNNLGTNHGVTVVGWDDNFAIENFKAGVRPTEPGAWLCKNSWGTRMYDDGYFWISYQDATIYDYATAFIAYDNSDIDNIYTYNGIYNTVYQSATAQANVFTASGNECLTNVAFNTGINTAYTIKVYGDLPSDYTSPVDGTLIYQQAGVADANRQIVKIPGLAAFDAGEKFAVVIESSCAYVEGSASSGSRMAYVSNTRESYYYKDGAWIDSSSEGKNNVYVTAFTQDIVPGDTYTVTFTCNDYSETRISDVNGNVTLPTAPEGYTYVFFTGDEPFDGTGVMRDLTVTMHCYKTDGSTSPDCICTTEYKCIYCGKDILPSVTAHNLSDSVVTPTATSAGYTLHTCLDCEMVFKDNYTFLDGWTTGSDRNISWGYSNGVLIVAGEGSTPDYESNGTPWNSFASNIIAVYVEEGITRIGNNSFYHCTGLQNISFPSTLEAIGVKAVYYCYSLTQVVLPENLTVLENSAFSNCQRLKTINLPDKLEEINGSAFWACIALTDVTIPASVLYIGDYAFASCKSMKAFTVDDDNEYYCSEDGILFEKGKTCLISYPAKKTNVYYNVPDEVSSFARCAFTNCDVLKYLDFSCKAKVLQQYTIYNCAALKYINLSENLTSITGWAIRNSESLKKIYIPSTVTTIASNAFVDSTISNVTDLTVYTDNSTSAAATFAANNSLTCNVVSSSHNYSIRDYQTNATCVDIGEKIDVCECGQFVYTATPANEAYHQLGSGTVTAPTCIARGFTTYHCSICEQDVLKDYTAIIPHSYTEFVSTTATCGAAGTSTYRCAAGCGLTTQLEAAATGNHSFVWITDTVATCGATGTKHEECTVCGETRSNGTVIAASGNHDYSIFVSTTATCGVDGKKTMHCSVCGAETKLADPATGNHSWTWITDEQPTCGAAGVKHEECTVCHAKQSEGTAITPTGLHDYSVYVSTTATCGADGQKTMRCSVCGGTTEVFDAATGNHSWTWIIDKAENCANTGIKHEECTVCQAKNNENTVIAATGLHDYSIKLSTTATCGADGFATMKCTVCGGTVQVAETATGNHSYAWITDTAATCGTTGVKHEECTVCETERSAGTVIPATGNHDYSVFVSTTATCGVDGQKTMHCSVCGAETKLADPATGNHSWTWITDSQPTCGAAGAKHEECTVCHAKQSEGTAIAATEAHRYTAQTVSAAALKATATCTSAAVYYYSCAVCGGCERSDAHTFTSGSPVAHDFSGAKRNNGNGTHSNACKFGCGTYSEAVSCACTITASTTGANCQTTGADTYACACGYSYTQNNSKYGSHSFSNGSCTICGAADPNYVSPENCSCECHSSNGFTQFIFKIKCFFWKLFRMEQNRYCECGKAHW